MPDIAPVIPLQPAAPAIAAATSVAPIGPAPGVGTGADFLGQLTAALKSLAGVVVTLPTSPASVTTAPTVSPLPANTGAIENGSETDSHPVDGKPSEKELDQISEILAALGLVLTPAPQTIQPPVPEAVVPTTVAPSQPVATQGLSAPQQSAAPTGADVPITTTPPSPVDPSGAPALTTSLDQGLTRPPTSPAPSVPTPPDQAVTPSPTTPVASVSTSPDQGVTPPPTTPVPPIQTSPGASAPVPETTATPTTTSSASVDARPSPVPPVAPTGLQPIAPVGLQPTPQSPEPPAHGTTPPTTVTPLVGPPPTMGSASFGQQTNGRGDSRQHHTDTTPPIHTVELNQPSTVVAPTTGPVVTNSAPLPQNVTPANVASQIAHQADLFRLPGNRGVRIQLHPEDLGGVQVTLRYAGNGGGIELHINVEHATTGALVQAGWSELRDALATQGISPDRLVMSVTGPNTATNLDFSSGNGGGYRPDQSPSGFTPNGQSGQQRNDANFGDDSRGSRGWQPANSGPTSTSPNDDASPSVHAAGATRIDYRV